MTFDEWWGGRTGLEDKERLREAYEAGRADEKFEAANRAGDAANEGEKFARRKVAVEAILIETAYDLDPERVRAIIAEAQG